jgi:signal recognition particle receptor subunit beta
MYDGLFIIRFPGKGYGSSGTHCPARYLILAFVNLKKKEVQVKVVYYGPGRGGKTTNLEYIYKRFNKRIKTEMVTIKTHGDRTLFFDFLPFDIGKIKGYDVKIQLYTVPGQVKYDSTRRLVLRGVDAIVFVADSMKVRREKNILALKNLQKNLLSYKKSIFKIPLVLQYNKRDLADQGIPVLPFEILEKDLNSQLKAPSFEASAMSGENVVQTMKQIISMTMRSLQRDLK